jgi:MFS family permease
LGVSDDKKINSNIGKYYLATSLAAFGFYTPIIQLFYLAHNLTIFQIAVLGVVWTVTKMCLEVPSSVLADKWNRKKVIILSVIFSMDQLVVLIYSTEYLFFIIASVFSAAAYAFLSGTDIAFFYDTLKESGQEKSFDKLWAKQQIYNQIPFIISFAASGFLFKLSPLLPFQLSLLFLFLSLMITLTLTEPKFFKPVEELNVWSHLKQSTKFIFNNQYLKSILLFIIMFSLGSDLSYGYGQIYLKQLAFPVVLFGVVYIFKSFLVTAAANIAPELRKKLTYQKMFGVQIITITLLFLGMAVTNNYIVGALCFILIAIPFGFFGISKSSYMHDQIESHQRATVDSMFSFFIATIFLIVEPVVGYLADSYSIKMPLFWVAMIMMVYCGYYVVNGYKRI